MKVVDLQDPASSVRVDAATATSPHQLFTRSRSSAAVYRADCLWRTNASTARRMVLARVRSRGCQ